MPRRACASASSSAETPKLNGSSSIAATARGVDRMPAASQMPLPVYWGTLWRGSSIPEAANLRGGSQCAAPHTSQAVVGPQPVLARNDARGTKARQPPTNVQSLGSGGGGGGGAGGEGGCDGGGGGIGSGDGGGC